MKMMTDHDDDDAYLGLFVEKIPSSLDIIENKIFQVKNVFWTGTTTSDLFTFHKNVPTISPI